MPKALLRDPLTHYYEGYFHVTLNVRDKAPVLGILTGHVGAPQESPDAPHVALTKLGRGVDGVWRSVQHFCPMVELLALQVMPEHIHALLHLKPGGGKHLGRVVGGLMMGCTHAYWDTLGIPWREMERPEAQATAGRQGGSDPMAATRAKAQAARWQDRDHTRSFRGPALFVRGYNDVQAITPEEVAIKMAYIRDNPLRRMIKQQMHDVFRIVRNVRWPAWTWQRVWTALCADRFLGTHTGELHAAWNAVTMRMQYAAASTESTPASTASTASTAAGTMAATSTAATSNGSTASNGSTGNASASTPTMPVVAYIGDERLLGAARKVSLICHRADAGLFERQREAVMRAAREGAVVVSAFISPREREILHQLLVEQLPVIEIVDNGFAERQTPVGKAFYACAERRMVLVSLWQYVYARDAEVTRPQCLVMNELARVISGVDDGWWKG